MSSVISADKSQKKYMLVMDLPEMMEAYERVGLQIPSVDFLEQRQQKLVSNIQEVLPDNCVEVMQASILANKIANILTQLLRSTPEAVVISTMHSMPSKVGGHCLQVNRIVDSTGKLLGVGARPGYGSLRQQFSDIKLCLENRPVILVEDGSFSGSTMEKMIRMCKEISIEIEHLVVGFLFPGARQNILKIFPREANIHCWREEDFLDWMPDHDFFPFIPNAGRVVGFSFNGHATPVHLHHGLSLCMPYVLPYGRPTEWASIPREFAGRFSYACVESSIAIFEQMECLNRRKITLENLRNTYPHVSLPVSECEQDFPHIETRILDMLTGEAQLLA